jgi:hypothetical protein
VLKAWGAELGTTPPVTVTGEPTVVGAPEQVFPEKYSYVTVPPALKTPAKVAESVTDCPTDTIVWESVVETEGIGSVTVSTSHALTAAASLQSPKYAAIQLYVPGSLKF